MEEKDTLTLTIRLHDPKEKKDEKLSASWVVLQVPREDLQLSKDEFTSKYLAPTLDELAHMKKP